MTTTQPMSNVQNKLLHAQMTNPFITPPPYNTYKNIYMPLYNTPSTATQMSPQNSYIPFQTLYMHFQMSYANLQYQHASELPMGRSVLSSFTAYLLNFDIPNTSKLPTLKTYNGMTNPDSHIDT